MDDDWDTLPAAAPAAAPAPADSEDPFGGSDDFMAGDGGAQPAAAQPASGGFDGFGDDDAFGADPAPSAVLGGELLGGDFMTGGEAVADAPSAAVDEAPVVPDDAPLIMGGGDDDFLGGEPAAPAAPAAPAMKIAEKKTSMFTTAPIVDNCDTTILDAWEEKHRQELKEKRAVAEKKRTEALKAGDEASAKLIEERKKQVESNKKKNRSDEAQFTADRDSALKGGLIGKESWEKVCSYVDLAADPKRKANVQKMKSIMIAVKATPPSTVKNFIKGGAQM